MYSYKKRRAGEEVYWIARDLDSGKFLATAPTKNQLRKKLRQIRAQESRAIQTGQLPLPEPTEHITEAGLEDLP